MSYPNKSCMVSIYTGGRIMAQRIEAEKYDKSLSIELANRAWDGNGCSFNDENDKRAYEITESAAN